MCLSLSLTLNQLKIYVAPMIRKAGNSRVDLQPYFLWNQIMTIDLNVFVRLQLIPVHHVYRFIFKRAAQHRTLKYLNQLICYQRWIKRFHQRYFGSLITFMAQREAMILPKSYYVCTKIMCCHETTFFWRAKSCQNKDENCEHADVSRTFCFDIESFLNFL